MRFKSFILSVLTAEAFLATAAPVVLKNPSFFLTVLPECGGKIVTLKSGESAFSLPEDVRHLPAYGLAKERFFQRRLFVCQSLYRSARTILPNFKGNWEIMEGVFDKNFFRLLSHFPTGKLRLATGKIVDGKRVFDDRLILSATDHWPAGIRLRVDEKEEFKLPAKFEAQKFSSLRLGRRWVSQGAYDELRIYDGQK